MNYNESEIAVLRKILEKPWPIQYIRIIKDLTFKDYRSRRTSLSAGEYGYILDEEKIFKLSGASAERKSKMMKELMDCGDGGAVYALVCGYECVLMPSDYEILDYVPNACCGELL